MMLELRVDVVESLEMGTVMKRINLCWRLAKVRNATRCTAPVETSPKLPHWVIRHAVGELDSHVVASKTSNASHI